MRAKLLEILYNYSKIPYQKWFKTNKAWNLSITNLLTYPKKTLGYELGLFLKSNNFSPQEKLENHDVFHVLTNIGTSVPEEIAMQYYLLGNGKRSAYLYAVLLLGTPLYLDKIQLFNTAYHYGKRAFSFHQLNYRPLLNKNTQELQTIFSITPL
ncbi:hypothetical protein HN014_12010 [Aquimarina sp. TRL1]|uniref:hypothetical protein n=1 Tax=Aquimarina sp. (strain TRL1) TaxID=2736252 RepID=UPI0015882C63|nr:hypothetical protein [Aquimarina sp. TRL1]QKX05610.1 hypothetical protein HN014_12010 [Aquimarina sp. TRL1]